MNFQQAKKALEENHTVTRKAWQSPDLSSKFLVYVKGSVFEPTKPPYNLLNVSEVTFKERYDLVTVYQNGHLKVCKAQVYNFTQEDLLAEDWHIALNLNN